MNTRLIAVLFLTTAFVAGAGAPAHAREEFPRAIASHLGSPTPVPPCSICHQYGKTGGDTLVTPFAWGMRARGLSGDESAVIDALDRVRADGVDSDGDGTGDVDELIAGTDPNSATSNPTTPGTVPEPRLGCTLAGEPVREPADVAWLFGAGLLLIRRSARRRFDRVG
ncbi:MAG TPA: thrombospondin type 3 repeat-containing protein [Polyangia bacterium]